MKGERTIQKDKRILTLLFFFLSLSMILAGCGQDKKERQARQEQAAKVTKEDEEEREEQKRRRQKTEEITAQARQIVQALDPADAADLTDISALAEAARQIPADIEAFWGVYEQEEEEFTQEAACILGEANESAKSVLQMEEAEAMLEQLYDREDGSVAMNTAKNNRIFRNVQSLIWQTPGKYEKKREEYQEAVDRISEAWDYVNDPWHYETSTLKVSVEERETSYTRYWVCHVQTFSPAQLCSALCGGTYGNPRATVSQEMEAHNGVIGVNGSGFSYSSGKPAPDKTMIKGGKVYEDTYSNGNIMCVTGDGGMFTAAAGLTVKQLLKRNVKDTYCFGPTLVEGGEKYPISGDFQQTYRYQRMAVGMVSPGEYYLVAVQGNGAGGSKGMTYEELQKVFLDLGCVYAYNLDGGGSTTLVFKGRVVNMLTDASGERPCGDILYFIDEDIIVHEEEAMLLP